MLIHDVFDWLPLATAFLPEGLLHDHHGALQHQHHHDHDHDGDTQPADDGAGDEHSMTSADELRALEGGVVRVDLLNNNNSQYYGDVAVGNPKQRFTAIFDTGSGITWIPGSKCESDTCQEHHRFASGESESFRGEPDKASSVAGSGAIHYGTGEVKYESGQDSFTFCDSHDNVGCRGEEEKQLTVPSQPFGRSTHQTTYPFRILPFDGILGLAPSGASGSVLHHLKAAKALPRNLLGVYLSEDSHRSGSVDFGGIEQQHIAPKGELHWHKITNPAAWQVKMKDVLVDGKPLHLCDQRPDGTCPAVVDTGSSLITGPSGEIKSLLGKIRTPGNCANIDKMPVVSLQLVDKDGKTVEYPLTPEEYTLRGMEEVPNTGDSKYVSEFPVLGTNTATAPKLAPRCEPGIGVMDVPGQKWVIGDTFLRRYYSVYDDDRGLVGFVRSIHPDEPAPVASTTAPDATKTSAMGSLLGLFPPCLPRAARRDGTRRCRKHWAEFV